MKTKLLFAFLSAFLVVNQTSFAGENTINGASQGDQSLEHYIDTNGSNLFNKQQSYLPYLQLGGTHFFNVNTAKAAAGADLFVPIWQESAHLIFTHLSPNIS